MTTDVKKRYTIRLPASIYNKLKKEADNMGVTISARLNQVLYEWNLKTEKDGKQEA